VVLLEFAMWCPSSESRSVGLNNFNNINNYMIYGRYINISIYSQ
jgi:hypothetical protein